MKKIISCALLMFLISGCTGKNYETLKAITEIDPTGASKILLSPLIDGETLARQQEADKIREHRAQSEKKFEQARLKFMGKNLDEIVKAKGVPSGSYTNSDGSVIVEWKKIWEHGWDYGICIDKFKFENRKMVEWISSNNCYSSGYIWSKNP